MNHRLLGGLTAAVMMSAFGAFSPSYAQDTIADTGLVPLPEAEQPPDLAEPGPSAVSDASNPEQTEEPDATVVEETTSNQDFETTNVLAHALDERQAATVYVRSIPVVTFIGGELGSLSASKELAENESAASAESDPVVRANQMLEQLEHLSNQDDATQILARWDSEQEAYIVAWGDNDLIVVGDQTILPDTTENPAEDALQIANRLRRLLGNAAPLSEVEGMPEPAADVQVVTSTITGMASWYGPGLNGRRSASGEVFNQNDLTAAHRTLPFGTRVRVTNMSNGRQVVVRINDRGPFGHGRIIDLSAGAASTIGLQASGVGRVQLEVLSAP